MADGSMKRATKDNADSALIGIATVAAWAIPTFTGVTIPPEVLAAAAGVMGAIGARLRD
jgi:hypothetical protein